MERQKMKSRLYRVFDNESKEPDRLVDASSRSRAIAHVVRERFEAKIATPHEVATLVTSGVLPETAGADDAAE
jgi:hypothetical protein